MSDQLDLMEAAIAKLGAEVDWLTSASKDMTERMAQIETLCGEISAKLTVLIMSLEAPERHLSGALQANERPLISREWPDGRPRVQRFPKCWHDEPVRSKAISLHRNSTLDDAVRTLVEEFGEERAPSRSALHRIWQQLDLMLSNDEGR